MNEYIPFHKPSIGEAEIAEVVETLRSGWLTTGPRTSQFEEEFRNYVHASHAIAVNSCTSGLHLALTALNIGPGDEVITTPLTFCATVNSILHVGATPVLADVQNDGNIDPESIKKRITPKTRAILPVHLAGLPCRMAEIWKIAREHRLHVVEDAAHAVGAIYDGSPIGASDQVSASHSDAVAFSFYATKSLTTGEGGMVTTPNVDLVTEMRSLCLHGMSADAWNRYSEKGSWYYEVTRCGFKYNLSDLQSAIGIHQLRRQEEFVAKRAQIAALYKSELSSVEELELPMDRPDSRHAWHLYIAKLKLDGLTIGRDEVIRQLRHQGVGTSVHFIPIPLHPAYAPYGSLSEEHCPAAMALYGRSISLPIFPEMTQEQVHIVAANLRDTLQASQKRAVFPIAALA